MHTNINTNTGNSNTGSGTLRQKLRWSGFLISLLCASGLAAAQDEAVMEIEIERDANELSDLLSGSMLPKPDVAPLLDTAMVLTSIQPGESTAYCRANNKNGVLVGRVRVRVPAGGVRFFLASDIVDERGFVGSVICTAAGYLSATEVMLGVVTSAIDVQQDTRADTSTMLFSVIATK